MAKVLSHEEIIQILKQFDEKWEIEDNGKKLKKEFKFKSFIEAFSFMTKIAILVIKENASIKDLNLNSFFNFFPLSSISHFSSNCFKI